MSKINQHNYEAFYLDYLEGNLGEELTAQLLLFLDENPAIKSELDGFEILELNADSSLKFNKESLRQNIDESNVEDYIIASVENEIDPDDAPELNEYLYKSVEARILAERYKKTILPEQVILFPEKNKLKKKGTTIYYLTPLLAAAAVALIFLVFNPFKTEQKYLPIMPQQTENKNAEYMEGELQTLESDAVAELKIVKETAVPVNNKVTSRKLNTEDSQETSIAISNRSDDIISDNQELVKLNPRTLNSVLSLKQQSIFIPDRSEITIEIAENKSLPGIETQQALKPNSKKDRRIDLWSLADFGLKVLGKLNERNYAVQPHYSDSGEVKSVTLITDKRRITTPAI